MKKLIGYIVFILLAMTTFLPGLAAAPDPGAGGLLKQEDTSIPKYILDAVVPLDRECEDAVRRAQRLLARRQLPDGSFQGQYGRGNMGELAFAILALMVNGTVPGEGEFSEHINRGVQFMLNNQTAEGLLSSRSGSQMYEHALATLALSEVYGMTANPRIRTALIRAVNLIVRSQHSAGGWRYQPRPAPGDISISVMQVMALRSAADAGVYVPQDTFDKAIRFVYSCYNRREKGFTYMANSSGAGFARTAAGVVSLQSVGLKKDPIIRDTMKFLMDRSKRGTESYYWYGHYYCSVALYHFGGEEWQDYYPRIKKKILNDWKRQGGSYNKVLDTAWAILVLGVPYRYLPIYQR